MGRPRTDVPITLTVGEVTAVTVKVLVIVALAVGTAVSVAVGMAIVASAVGAAFSRLMTGVSVAGTAVAGKVSVAGGGVLVVAVVAVARGTAVGARVGKAGCDTVTQADRHKSSKPWQSRAILEAFALTSAGVGFPIASLQ